MGLKRRGNFPCCAVKRHGKLRVTLKGPTCILGVGPRGGAIVLNSTKRLGTRCVITRRSGVISRSRLFAYPSLTIHVHCEDHPVPYQIGELRSKHLLIHFSTRTSTVTPKRSTIFCRNQQILNNTFVTSRHNVKLIVRRGGS